MFERKKKNASNFEYKVKDKYNANNLYVANLEERSYTSGMIPDAIKKTTNQKYLFEILYTREGIKYREIFTGLIFDKNINYKEGTYVTNVVPLKEQIPTITNDISRYTLLLIMDRINTEEKNKKEESNVSSKEDRLKRIEEKINNGKNNRPWESNWRDMHPIRACPGINMPSLENSLYDPNFKQELRKKYLKK